MKLLAAGGAALVAAALTYPAQAQRTVFHGLSDCTRLAAVAFKRRDHAFRRFIIDRASVVEDRYAAMIGNQFVTTIYSGSASYDSGAGARKVMFVCLHGGTEKGALLVYTLPH